MHLKCCSPINASRNTQATCVHTQACAHMQAHVLTCVNCKRTARRQKHMYIFYMYTLHTCTKHGRQSRPPTRDQRHPHRKPTRLEPHWPAPRRPRCIAPSGAGDARDEARNSLPDIQSSLDQLHSVARHCFAFQRQSSRESVRQTTTAAVLGHSVRRRQH